jgi:hypothetical protein
MTEQLDLEKCIQRHNLRRDLQREPLNIVSLGAGVQSTTMVLMAAHGEITPMPDIAIFADTGAEPDYVYDHLRWLQSDNVLPFPVRIVKATKDDGNIVTGINKMVAGQRWASIPAFVEGSDGRAAPVRRQCTSEYKIEPIRREVRQLAGLYKKRSPDHVVVRQWIGISTDEIQRMKPSNEGWIENYHPLIEHNVSRMDCYRWMRQHGYPRPPKSACYFCPYHSDHAWLELKRHHPEEFQKAVEIDRTIRQGAPETETRKGTKPMYLHRSLIPLEEIDFEARVAKRDGRSESQPDMFNNECEGMCGV